MKTRRVIICHTDPSYVSVFTQHAASENRGKFDWWNLNRHAKPEDVEPNDLIVVYITGPLSSFIGTCVVDSFPGPCPDPNSQYKDRLCVDVRDAQAFPTFLRFDEIYSLVPDWKYLKACHEPTIVPDEHKELFLKALGISAPLDVSEQSDIEGLQTEIRTIIRSRSKRLRDTVFYASNGICEVCKTDFSKLLEGRGIRVLQVHHRDQLSSRDEPSKTKEGDLAVVCANCHLLLHLNPRKAILVETLIQMLDEDGFFD